MNLSHPQKLKFVFAATVLAAAGIEGTVLAQHHRAPAGRDAFLTYQVDSTDELVATLQKNKTLRQRYARHFGVPENRIIEFVKDALVPYRVPRNCVVTDHGVTKSGRIYPVKVTLKKGTRVWATRSGLPILKWACANPVAKTLPGTLMASRPHFSKAPLGGPSMELASSYPSPILAPLPDASTASLEAVTPDTASVDTSALTLPPALTGIGSSSVPSVAAAPLSGGKGGPGVAPFLIPAVIAVATSGGGGSSNSPTDSTVKTPTTIPTDTTIQTPTGGGSTDTPSGGGNTGGTTGTGGTDTGGTNTGSTNTGSTNTGGTNTGGTTAGGDNTSGGTTGGGTTTGGTNTGGTNTGTGGTNDSGGGNSTTDTPTGGDNGTGGTTGGGTNTGGTTAGGDNTGGGTTGGGSNGGSPTVPEPGTLALFAAAGFPALIAARKRFAKK